MLNRILIRTKTVQTLYSYLLTREDTTLAAARKQLDDSQRQGYDLYYALLSLITDITRQQELNLDYARHKYLPTEEDANPNMRFVNNKFAAALNDSIEFNDYRKQHENVSWQGDFIVELLLSKIKECEAYEEYMALDDSDLMTDAELWRTLLRQVVLPNPDFADALEAKSAYWPTDVESVSTFVLKTIRRWGQGEPQRLLPQFKDEEDAVFGRQLFDFVINNMEEYNEIIDSCIDRDSWDAQRIAFMDRVILLTAFAEMLNFPKIPTQVTMNEYIELAKNYSTANSGSFVNGVLHSLSVRFKKQNIIIKD